MSSDEVPDGWGAGEIGVGDGCLIGKDDRDTRGRQNGECGQGR